MKTEAVILRSYDVPPSVEERVIPELRQNEILVEIEAATTCGTDVHIASGTFANLANLPLVMGHEGTGRVVKSNGRNVDVNGNQLRVGDRIVWAHPWCGNCYFCAVAGQPTLCDGTVGYGWGPSSDDGLNGTFARHLIVSADSKVIVVPDQLDPALVSSATCALRTVMQAFSRIPRIKFSDAVVVLGSGPVGLYAAAAALAAGAHKVHLFGAPRERLAITHDWGLGLTLDVFETTSEERRNAVISKNENRGVDLVIECAGPADAFTEGISLLRKGGTFLMLGQAHKDKVAVDTTSLKVRQINIVSSLSAEITHFNEAIKFLTTFSERFHLSRMVDGERYGLSDISKALGAMKSGSSIKPVIIPTKSN
jgi:D-arabinose 1-dehydrogenase-like Zn-dependent alcohol dehydrogenase